MLYRAFSIFGARVTIRWTSFAYHNDIRCIIWAKSNTNAEHLRIFSLKSCAFTWAAASIKSEINQTENPINPSGHTIRPQFVANRAFSGSIWARNAPKFLLNRFVVTEWIIYLYAKTGPPILFSILLSICHTIPKKNLCRLKNTFGARFLLRVHWKNESPCQNASNSQMSGFAVVSYPHALFHTRGAFYRSGRSARKRNEEPFVHAASSGGSANVRSGWDLIYDTIRNDCHGSPCVIV